MCGGNGKAVAIAGGDETVRTVVHWSTGVDFESAYRSSKLHGEPAKSTDVLPTETALPMSKMTPTPLFFPLKFAPET